MHRLTQLDSQLRSAQEVARLNILSIPPDLDSRVLGCSTFACVAFQLFWLVKAVWLQAASAQPDLALLDGVRRPATPPFCEDQAWRWYDVLRRSFAQAVAALAGEN